jgi:hypothetical protein
MNGLNFGGMTDFGGMINYIGIAIILYILYLLLNSKTNLFK